MSKAEWLHLSALVSWSLSPLPGRTDYSTDEPLGVERGDLTGHGFRATFKTWCDDAPDIPTELAEACLAHVNRDKVERAY